VAVEKLASRLLIFSTKGGVGEKPLSGKKGCVPEIFVTGSPDRHTIEKVL
jgi:hypothetical protein